MKAKTRLLEFIEYVNSNQRRFEIDCSISQGYVNNIRESIGTSVLNRILKRYPELNKIWLLHGEGEMLLVNNFLEELKPNYSNIPFFDVDFDKVDIDNLNRNNADFTMSIPDFNGCIAFRTYSDSMHNLFKNGDILFVTKIQDWESHLEYGQIYGIICKDNRRYLKYIRKSVNKDETHFLLKSENADFDDFLIPKSSIKSIWLIHGYMSKRI